MAASGGPNIIDDGLVLYLDAANFESYPGSGSDWLDLSGNNNHGTLVNGPIFVSSGSESGISSLLFDGVNDYVSIPSMSLQDNWSVSIFLEREYISRFPLTVTFTTNTVNTSGRMFLISRIFNGMLSIEFDSTGSFFVSTFGMGEWEGTFIPFVLKFDSTGSLVDTFNCRYGVGGAISSFIKITSNDELYVGGTNIDRFVQRNRDNGSIIQNNPFSFNSSVSHRFFIDEINRKVYHAGDYTVADGVSRRHICKFDLDTRELDLNFDTSTAFNNSSATPLGLTPEGHIIYTGTFTSYKGTPVNHIAVLNSSSAELMTGSFNSGAGFNDTRQITFELDSQGRIYAVGRYFTSYSGSAVNRIVRINSDGTLDTNYVANAPNFFNFSRSAIKLQPDNKLIVVSYSGNSVYRLNEDGTRDTTFPIGVVNNNFLINFGGIGIQPDGKIILSTGSPGLTYTYNNTSFKTFIRLDNSGSVDPTFRTDVGFTDSTHRGEFYFTVINSSNNYQQISDFGFTGRNSPPWWRSFLSVPRLFTLVKTNDNRLKVYVNNTLRRNFDLSSYNNMNLNINRILSGYMNVNTIRIYNKELTQNEIDRDMNQLIKRYGYNTFIEPTPSFAG